MSSPIDAAAVIARMKSAAGVARDEDLAKELGLSRSAIANWRHRNSIPIKPLVAFAGVRNVSLDSLVTGVGAWESQVDERLLAVALKKAAAEWAMDHPDGELQVSELASSACRFYDNFAALLRASPEEAKNVVDALATLFEPYRTWRRVKSSGLAKVETRAKVGT